MSLSDDIKAIKLKINACYGKDAATNPTIGNVTVSNVSTHVNPSIDQLQTIGHHNQISSFMFLNPTGEKSVTKEKELKKNRKLGQPIPFAYLLKVPFIYRRRSYHAIPVDVIYNGDKLSTTVFFADGHKSTVRATSNKDKDIRLGILIAIAKTTLSPKVSFEDIWKHRNDNDINSFFTGYVFSYLFKENVVKDYAHFLKFLTWLMTARKVDTKKGKDSDIVSFASGALILTGSKDNTPKPIINSAKVTMPIPTTPPATPNVSVNDAFAKKYLSTSPRTIRGSKFTVVDKTNDTAIIELEDKSKFVVYRNNHMKVKNVKLQHLVGFISTNGQRYYFMHRGVSYNISKIISSIWSDKV